MHGRMTSCHDGLPSACEELVYFRKFPDRLPDISLHALVGRVEAGRFPPPRTWRGAGGTPAWSAADVAAALSAVAAVETYDGEGPGAYGDP